MSLHATQKSRSDNVLVTDKKDSSHKPVYMVESSVETPDSKNEEVTQIVLKQNAYSLSSKVSFPLDGSHMSTNLNFMELLPTHLVQLCERARLQRRLTKHQIDNLSVAYQRVKVLGDDISGVLIDDLRMSAKQLLQALMIRAKYMSWSVQKFPRATARCLHMIGEDLLPSYSNTMLDAFFDDTSSLPSAVNVTGLLQHQFKFRMVEGVMRVYRNEQALAENKPMNWSVPSRVEFTNDQTLLTGLVFSGPLKSFCFHRLAYLESKFNMHKLLNDIQEMAQMKQVIHRDFYNVRKVDNNVQAAFSMNRHQLIRGIREIIKNTNLLESKEVVFHIDKQPLNLLEVFERLNLPIDRLHVDMLDDEKLLVSEEISGLGKTAAKRRQLRLEKFKSLQSMADEDGTGSNKKSSAYGATRRASTLAAQPTPRHICQVRTPMKVTVSNKQTWILLPTPMVPGAWMAYPVRKWTGASFGDLSSREGGLLSIPSFQPMRQWQTEAYWDIKEQRQNNRRCVARAVPPDQHHRPPPHHLSIHGHSLGSSQQQLGPCDHCSKPPSPTATIHKGQALATAFKTMKQGDRNAPTSSLVVQKKETPRGASSVKKSADKKMDGRDLESIRSQALMDVDSDIIVPIGNNNYALMGQDLLTPPPASSDGTRSADFNHRFNPHMLTCLRQIFLSTGNPVGGRFFASILKKVIGELEASKFQHAEMRLAFYGRTADEWHQLASWAINHQVESENVRWIIEIPRLFDVYRSHGVLSNFQLLLDNIFAPLYAVTIKPESDEQLVKFLESVSGFDLIDDEYLPDQQVFNSRDPLPANWTSTDNPCFSYYMYYVYANLVSLNQLRRLFGYNTFALRPVCTELGSISHLVSAFMTSESISHNFVLSKAPVLMYLFYLARIGITTSIITSKSATLKGVNAVPLQSYLSQGLLVSLCTCQPVYTHMTREPLVEEYTIASQVLKLTRVDLCEIARNSVLISGFPHEKKQDYIGIDYTEEGPVGNDPHKTNLPSIRVAFRHETFLEEFMILLLALRSDLIN